MKAINRLVVSSLIALISCCLVTRAKAQLSNIPLISADIGSVSSPGVLANGNGYYTLTASGDGFGGTADSGQMAYQSQTGDFTMVAQIWEQTGGGETGIMVRPSLDPSSSFIEVSYLAGVGTTVRYRESNGQESVLEVQDETLGTPVLLALVRSGNTFTPYENDPLGGTWSQLGDPLYAPDDWTNTVCLGLVETSGDNTKQASAQINDVLYLPEYCSSSQEIGHPALVGSTNFNNDVYTITGSGTGIGTKQDQSRYTFSWAKGDLSLVVRVSSLTAAGPQTQAGLMIRGSLDASAPEITLALTPNGVNASWRAATGGSSSSNGIPSVTSTTPCWLKLSRTGNTFSVATSADGVTWSTPTSTTLSMPVQVYYGLTVTSGNPAAYASAIFDNLLTTHQ